MRRVLILTYIILFSCVCACTAGKVKKNKTIDKTAAELATWTNQQEFDSLYITALILKQTQSADTAISMMQKAVKLTTDHEDINGMAAAMFFMSNSYRDKGDLKRSLGSIKVATAQDSINYWYGMSEGNLLMASRHLPEARERFETVLRNNPTKTEVLYTLADIYLRLDSVDLCMQMMDKIEEQEGISPQMIQTKFMILKEAGRVDQAFDEYRRLITKYPYNIQYRLQYAKVLSQYKRVGEAQLCYQAIVEIEPDNAEALDNLLQIQVASTENKDSLKMMADEALKASPEVVTAYLIKAWLFALDENNKEAIRQYRSALNYIDNSEAFQVSSIWGNLGDLEHMEGNEHEAFECYDKAIKYNPNNYSVLNNYAYYLSQKGENLSQAEAMAQKVVQQYPDNATYLDTYAWILYLQGNNMLALFYQKRAIENNEDESVTLFDHYGDMLMADGNEEEAKAQWKRALECKNITPEEVKTISKKLK